MRVEIRQIRKTPNRLASFLIEQAQAADLSGYLNVKAAISGLEAELIRKRQENWARFISRHEIWIISSSHPESTFREGVITLKSYSAGNICKVVILPD